MNKLTVGHGDEKSRDQAEMNDQQRSHCAGLPKSKEQQTAQADTQEQKNEAHFHGKGLIVCRCPVHPQLQGQEPDGAGEDGDPADGTGQHRKRKKGYGAGICRK